MDFIHIESFPLPSKDILAQCLSEADHERSSTMNPLLLRILPRNYLDSLSCEAGHERLLVPRKENPRIARERPLNECSPAPTSLVQSSSRPKMNICQSSVQVRHRLYSLLSLPEPPITGLTERVESPKANADSRPRPVACTESSAEVEGTVHITEWTKDMVLRATEEAAITERHSMDEGKFKFLLSKWKSQSQERDEQEEKEEHLVTYTQEETQECEVVCTEKPSLMSSMLRRRNEEIKRGLALLLTIE